MIDWIAIGPEGATLLDQPPARLPEQGFVWCDCSHDAARAWTETATALTGASVFEAHLLDAENLNHPSYFESTADYEMIVFRSLAALPDEGDPAEIPRLRTRPATFFLFPGLLVTVRAPDSRSFAATRDRLLGVRSGASRAPAAPEELMLRILNAMVDRYLELRQPLAEALERLQRELLAPRRQIRDWYPLLEARREARRLQDLCEEQLDAVQEWRDERLEGSGYSPGDHGAGASGGGRGSPGLSEALQVRASDLVSHIDRVLNHARRMEASLETAVQLHFSATAHQTNEVMRTLTAITAIFLPLTLITGIFGMNFEFIPGLHSPTGFWWTIAAMVVIAVALLALFRARAFLHESAFLGRRRAARRPPARPPG
ncbi:magnesium transporter CorA family protein [Burkholderiaceae bacterium FT117]|uniref:magnesium transporter CorA family protein n=1 Tax=Zeimonas sediminis TaxID=2944268 RepID=UPI002342E149|nr:magnesium transporter CorA family protein [Zeimonas sediminis]MCM5570885.1 magnesium transporter CorA family protein [Zeimonas sediminis]